MESHQNKIISVENITVDFGNFRALDNVNAEINAGDFVAITGPNGGGKSTLLKTMLHLLTPTKGRVRYFNGDEEVDSLRFGYLPQKSNIDNRFPITVEEVVASGLLGERRNWRGKFSDAASEKIEATMKKMGVDGFRRQVIGTLSGGQLQRTLLGRAVISNPDIVVLDEPLSYVDHAFVEQIYGIVADLAKRSTVVLVSHEMTVISEMANRHWIVDHALHQCHAAHHYLKTECDR
ncbi:MAG: ATP-binding cassette domain-containing protein [Porphyromonadaceae bacterium]|nr:ATP-binding cassette domain-containing protein [Porphyromonadaceae bacterium]